MAFTELIKTKNMTDEELESYVKKNIGQTRPVADTLFDDDAFEEREVKRRVREARLSLKQRRELAKKEASERGEPPPTTTYITTRSAMSVSGRLRDPRASSGDLYSTKRMILSDTKTIGSERKSIVAERRSSQAASRTSAKEEYSRALSRSLPFPLLTRSLLSLHILLHAFRGSLSLSSSSHRLFMRHFF